jgi:formamidopyrimidine-DNA glycosylase
VPEIPFIETLVANLSPQVVGQRIRSVQMHSPSLLKTYDPPVSALAGKVLEAVSRRGKVIRLDLSGGVVAVFHLMRDGRLAVLPASRRRPRDVAFALQLENGQELRLVEPGPKKRAALYVLRAEEVSSVEPLGRLGLDPLDGAFTLQALSAMLDEEQAHVKRFLGLQRYIAGIGNAYSDEILWEARLSPFVAASKLNPGERARLYQAIQDVLRRAIEEHRAHFGDRLPMQEPPALLRVHRHAGEPCPRCGSPIAAVYYSERETYYCPTCQTEGKVYADRRLSRLLK